jgi:hypothetical protein
MYMQSQQLCSYQKAPCVVAIDQHLLLTELLAALHATRRDRDQRRRRISILPNYRMAIVVSARDKFLEMMFALLLFVALRR